MIKNIVEIATVYAAEDAAKLPVADASELIVMRCSITMANTARSIQVMDRDFLLRETLKPISDHIIRFDYLNLTTNIREISHISPITSPRMAPAMPQASVRIVTAASVAAAARRLYMARGRNDCVA